MNESSRFMSFHLVLGNSSLGRVLMMSTVIVLLAGCKTQEKRPGVEGYHELIRRQQEALAIEQLKQPVVYFRGLVQKPIVTWREDLTLAEALLEAGYTQPLSPRVIRVHRQGRSHNVDVTRLLRGMDNPLLEPGDVVEVVR